MPTVDYYLMAKEVVDAVPSEYRHRVENALSKIMWTQMLVLKEVEDNLQQIKTDLTYLVFDLEATRRERDELKFRIEQLED